MSGPAFGRLVVVGVGLIGGSVALALRARGLVREVVGVGRTEVNLEAALRGGIIDRAVLLSRGWTGELDEADVVLVATPVAQSAPLFEAMRDTLGAETIVTDAGSTKADVVDAARRRLGPAITRFVPAHPIAGTENSGATAAFATLFEGRQVVITPLAETAASALRRVRALWQACGATVLLLDATVHDRALAAVSHLPHLVAAAYVAGLAARSDADRLFALAGTGFRDFTRIAAASPEMWRDVTLANRDALADEIAALRAVLENAEAAMRRGDGAALQQLFQAASAARRAWALRDEA